MKRRYPLQVHISTLFLLLVLVLGAVLGGMAYRSSRDMLESTAEELTVRIHRETATSFSALLDPAGVAVHLLSRDPLALRHDSEGQQALMRIMRELLDSAPATTAIYVGYRDGDFFLLRRLGESGDNTIFHAPKGAVYVLQRIEREGSASAGEFVYYDGRLAFMGRESLSPAMLAYDPRTRGWYQQAIASEGTITTDPYLFFSTGRSGLTMARRSLQEGVVVGVDIRLETLSTLLARQRVTPDAQLALVSGEGLVVAAASHMPLLDGRAVDAGGKVTLPHLDDGFPVLAQLKTQFGTTDSGTAIDLDLDGRHWHGVVRALEREGGAPLYLVSAVPDDQLFAAAHHMLIKLGIAMLLVIAIAVPLTMLIARRISRDLKRLADVTEAVQRFDFSAPTRVDSLVLEVNQLSKAIDGMKRTIRRFLDITQAVAGEKNFGQLLPLLLGETRSAAEAGYGVLYLCEDGLLKPAATTDAHGTPLASRLADVAVDQAGVLMDQALRSGHAVAGELSADERGMLGLSEAVPLDVSRFGVAIPLNNRQGQLVGALLLLRDTPIEVAQLSFVAALSGNAAVSLESRELIEAQKELFAAFVRLIAGAIDAKSPYTGGHCERVPALAKMLAEAACQQQDGPYADFQLDDEQWEAVHIASWLHDCGKVTTPEYVVDKATKLETLYDRIHEVRMRFEVLKRDAEIAALKAQLAGDPEVETQIGLAAQLRQLDEDFAFVARCNEGGEFMRPEDKARLQAIAGRTWVRTLDDRIGISYEERERKAREAAASLPVIEPLLSDKAEHRIVRRPGDCLPPDNALGIRMAAPELLYNRGELYNLLVERGTLSAEERYKINDHIVQTLVMLDQLPFPRHLRTVPEIAGGHHEKMDGTGYPRGLHRDGMSPLARMLAIADIFEALTAVDRPYKRGKTLSQSLAIMARMRDEQHIDSDLFTLFLRSGIHLRYAKAYLRPEQIDEVDIETLLGTKTEASPA